MEHQVAAALETLLASHAIPCLVSTTSRDDSSGFAYQRLDNQAGAPSTEHKFKGFIKTTEYTNGFRLIVCVPAIKNLSNTQPTEDLRTSFGCLRLGSGAWLSKGLITQDSQLTMSCEISLPSPCSDELLQLMVHEGLHKLIHGHLTWTVLGWSNIARQVLGNDAVKEGSALRMQVVEEMTGPDPLGEPVELI